MKKIIKDYIMITAAMFLVSFGVYFFLGPSHIIVGSLAGFAYVVCSLTGLPVSLITLVLNIVLLILGLIIIGKDFGFKTFYTSILLSVFLFIFEQMYPSATSLTGNEVFDLCAYLLICAYGNALLFHLNASSGGIDIVAKIVSKFTNMDIGKCVTISGLFVSLSSLLVYDIGTLVISFIATYANGLVIDYFTDGFNKKKKVCIISDDYEKIRNYVINTLHRGVTLDKVIGGYENKEKTELQIIATKYEYKKIINFLKQENIKGFVTITTISEVVGTWKN